MTGTGFNKFGMYPFEDDFSLWFYHGESEKIKLFFDPQGDNDINFNREDGSFCVIQSC